MLMAGGRTYKNDQFKNLMNRNYYPLSAMQASVDKLKASRQIDITTMEYGEYQPILTPLDQWPNGSGADWEKSKNHARAGLASQPNNLPVSADEPSVVPLTKLGLLDATLRKCFNSTPPIPMQIDVQEQPHDSPNAAQHDIKLVWTYGTDGIPTMLRFTMICPYGARSKDDTAAQARKALAEVDG
jgi:hypothetical protein